MKSEEIHHSFMVDITESDTDTEERMKKCNISTDNVQ